VRLPAAPVSALVAPSGGSAPASGGLPHDPFLDPESESSEDDEAAGCRVPARLTTSTRSLARAPKAAASGRPSHHPRDASLEEPESQVVCAPKRRVTQSTAQGAPASAAPDRPLCDPRKDAPKPQAPPSASRRQHVRQSSWDDFEISEEES